MQLTVTGRHVSISEPVKSYAEEKLVHLLKKHGQARVTKAHIIMDVQKYTQIVEMELHGAHANIYSKVISDDMYKSIDKVIDKVENQLIKLKSKYNKRRDVRNETIRVPAEAE